MSDHRLFRFRRPPRIFQRRSPRSAARSACCLSRYQYRVLFGVFTALLGACVVVYPRAAVALECAIGGTSRSANSTRHCTRQQPPTVVGVPDAPVDFSSPRPRFGDPQSPASHPNADPPTGTRLSIDLVSGNKHLGHTDAHWPGGLLLARYYNSLNPFDLGLGPAWRHSFDTVLSIEQMSGNAGGRWQGQVIQADGRRIIFNQHGPVDSRGRFVLVPSNPLYGSLHVQSMLSADRRYRWQWQDGSRLLFSATGRLTAIDRTDGQRLLLTYQPSPVPGGQARLTTVRNRYGQALQFFYDKQSARLSRVTLPDNTSVQYRYGEQGELTSVLVNGSLRWQYGYADEHIAALTTVKGRDGHVRGRYAYNGQGRAVLSSPSDDPDDPLAIRVQYRIPSSVSDTGESVVTDARNRQTRYHWRFDPRRATRQILAAHGPGCPVCPASGYRRQYDNNGRPVSITNHQGRVLQRWRYDRAGRLHRIDSRSAGGSWYNRQFVYASEQVDARLVQISEPSVAPGKRYLTQFSYNALGQLTRVTQSGYAPRLDNLGMAPEAMGNPRSADAWVRNWRPIRRSTRYQYVSRGPAQGLVQSVDGPLPGTADTTHYRYNKTGRLIRVSQPGGHFLAYSYDGNGRLAEQHDHTGAVWRYAVEPDGRVMSQHRGVSVAVQFDPVGQPVQIDRSDQPSQWYEWQANGRLKKILNERGQWLTRQQLGRAGGSLPDVIDLATGSPGRRAQFDVASDGRNGPVKQELVFRDDFGRPLAVADPDVGVFRQQFDPAGRLTVRSFVSNDSPDRVSTRLFQYNDAGQLTGIRDQDGPLLKNRYERGQLVSRQDRYEQVSIAPDATSRDRVWAVQYKDAISGIGFKKPLRLARHHDSQGRLVRRTLGNGWSVVYQWTRANRLKAVLLKSAIGQPVSLASELRWMPFGGGASGLISARYGNGSRYNVELDNQLRVTSVNHGAGKPSVHLTYNADGQIVAQQVGQRSTRYEYNKSGQLIAWTLPGGRSQHLQSLPGSKAKPRKPGQPVWVSGSDGRVAFSRDNKGNAYRYVHNHTQQRIGKIVINKPAASRWFVYDEQRLFLETDASGRPVAAYLYLDNRPFVMLHMKPGNEVVPYWIHTDHRGLPLFVSDRNNRIVWQGAFTPYGRLLNASLLAPRSGEATIKHTRGFMPLRLPGQYEDTETGLHDNYMRTYNPDTGRYLGPDPLGTRPGAMRYGYARLSPMDTTDPLGLYELDVHYYMTYFLARMAGIGHIDADVIAHANQGIDVNEATRPMDPLGPIEAGPQSVFINQDRLRAYHFVLYDFIPRSDPDGLRMWQQSTETANPQSWQLANLQMSVGSAREGCTQMQLLGEMLHAYQDTYAHRNHRNIPMSATNDYGMGTGHAIFAHSPDYTYNHRLVWRVNEDRTFQMQQDVYHQLLAYGNSEMAVPINVFQDALRQFNATQENDRTGFQRKLEILDQVLAQNGVTVMNNGRLQGARFLPARSSVREGEETVVYSESRADASRGNNLCGQRYQSQGTIRPNC